MRSSQRRAQGHVEAGLPPAFFREGYALVSQIHIIPDSVSLEGPLGLIINLPDLVYLNIPQRNIDENFNDVVEVKFPNDEYIRRNPPTVDITFQVDKLVEKNDSVRLELINTPKNAWPFMNEEDHVHGCRSGNDVEFLQY